MDRSVTTSASMSVNPCPVGGLKHTPACPEHVIPAALCRVIEADGRAKSASRFDWTGLVRPRMVSNNPISWGVRTRGRSRRPAHLGLECGELGEALVGGGMGLSLIHI